MKVVVTGGAGFIGANLCRVLAFRHDVVVLDDLSTGRLANLAGTDITIRLGSVRDAGVVRAACRDATVIVHLAAVPSVLHSIDNPRRSHETNVSGTLNVLEVAREIGAHVVLASSSSVCGNDGPSTQTEDLLCRPTSPHGVSKLAAESYAAAYRTSFGLDTISFRFFNVFGPLQAPDHAYAAVIPAFLLAALRGVPLTIHGDGEQSRDFTFVDTVIRVLADAVERRLTRETPVNVAFGTRTTVNELVDLLSDIFGRRLPVEHTAARAGDIRHSRACPETFLALFPDVRPVTLRAGLEKTISWMESQSDSFRIALRALT